MESINISPFEQYIIDKIRELRVENGYSQRDFADLLDISYGFIAKVESTSKRAKYNLNHINAAAKLFKCSPRDLLPEQPI